MFVKLLKSNAVNNVYLSQVSVSNELSFNLKVSILIDILALKISVLVILNLLHKLLNDSMISLFLVSLYFNSKSCKGYNNPNKSASVNETLSYIYIHITHIII